MPKLPNNTPTREPHDFDESPDLSWRGPRVWGVGEDPLAWTVPLPWFGAVRLRAHVLLIMWMGAEMVAWVPRSAIGLVHVIAGVVSIFGIILIRELVREHIRRAAGGESQPVVLWPLGGLGATPLGPVPRPFLAESGGLLANAFLVPILGYLVIASGASWEALTLDLLSPGVTAGGLRSRLQIWAWWAYYANAAVLVANALLPMLPLDCGRLVRAVTAHRGPSVARRTVRVAMFTALAVFVFGACMGEFRVLAIGVLGAFTSYMDLRRAEFLAAAPIEAATDDDLIGDEAPAEPPMEAAPHAELDSVLRQISALGLESLSPEQHEVLRRETDRRRRR